MIRQRDLYWYDFGEPAGSGPGFVRPCLVVQNDAWNESRIHTVVVCALTSNLRRARVPGNVLLEEGEAGLPERSVINISQLFTVDKEELQEKIGTLSPERVQQAFEGIYRLLKPKAIPSKRPDSARRGGRAGFRAASRSFRTSLGGFREKKIKLRGSEASFWRLTAAFRGLAPPTRPIRSGCISCLNQ